MKNEFGFDVALATRIAVILLNNGWAAYDAFKVANYESGGIPTSGPSLSNMIEQVSQKTGMGKGDVAQAAQKVQYSPPPSTSERNRANQVLASSGIGGFFESIPIWVWAITGIGTLLFLYFEKGE